MKIILFILWLIVIAAGAFTFNFIPASYNYIYGFLIGSVSATILSLTSMFD